MKILSFGGVGTEGDTTSNGQEGFGLMVRDFVPQYPGSSIGEVGLEDNYFAGSTGGSSNMVMVGGIKRGVRAAIRNGVTGPPEAVTDPNVIPDASKSRIEWLPAELDDYSPYPTLEDRPDFPTAGSTYRLSLERNNSGFAIVITPPPGKGATAEYFFSETEVLTSIVPDKFYVGLFAARAAEVEFTNIVYRESDAASDAPKVEPLPEIITPVFNVLSPAMSSTAEYKIRAIANVPGYLSVKQGSTFVPGAEYVAGQLMTEPTSNAVEPFMFFDIPVYNLSPGENSFQLVFHPEASSEINNVEPIKKTLLVHHKSYFNVSTPIYVSPDGRGSGKGTIDSPLDLQTAINYVLPGQTIVMTDGVYRMRSVEIPRYNDGSFSAPKRIEAQNRDKVFIDFEKKVGAKGMVLGGNYWEISGIHVRNSPDKVKGLVVMGNNNTLEWIKTYNNGDTGFQISGRSWEPKIWWPRNNTIRYSESYNNKDAAMTDADGFAAKLTVGNGNRFEWCISHNNNDDGWDLFTKKETGAIGVVTIENCISYHNGQLMDGTFTNSGRNGFKLGGEGISVAHVVRNSIAFENGAHGFTSNSNPAVNLENLTSYENGGK